MRLEYRQLFCFIVPLKFINKFILLNFTHCKLFQNFGQLSGKHFRFKLINFQVNSLNKEVLTEFNEIYNQIERDPAVKAVVLISSKTDCFIAGADIQ